MTSGRIFCLPVWRSFSNTDLIMSLPLKSFHGLPCSGSRILILDFISNPVSSNFTALSFLPTLPLALAISSEELTSLFSSALMNSYSSSGPLGGKKVTSFSKTCQGTTLLSVVRAQSWPQLCVFSFLYQGAGWKGRLLSCFPRTSEHVDSTTQHLEPRPFGKAILCGWV